MSMLVFGFPMFVILRSDGQGAVFVNSDKSLHLPLFSSMENVALYAPRLGLHPGSSSFGSIETVNDLLPFLTNPTPRAPGGVAFRIMFDPIDEGLETLILGRDELIEACQAARRSGGSQLQLPG